MNREMKNSEVKWIGDIPLVWEMIPNKYLFVEHCDNVGEKWNECQLLSLTTKGVKEKDINSSGGKVPNSYDNYQIVKPGDMIFCLFDLDVSAVFSGLSSLNGMITSAYNVYTVNHKYIDELFANYWFQYVFSNRYYKTYSKNIRYTITSENFGLIKTPCPSIEEQRKIGKYLDKKTLQIDALIANQEKQIAKLKDYKQSLITKVMTKGLNPNVEMKDSGEDSIGFVPVHWNLLRAKFVFNEFLKGAGISKDEVFENGDIQCVRYGEIYTKYDISFKKAFSNTIEDKIPSKVYLEKGDIIFSATGELVEEIGKNVVYLGKEKCLAGGDIIVGKHSENAEFLNYAMYCSASQIQKSRGKAKLKVVHISATNIGNVIVSIPPVKEQIEIITYLNKKMVAINKIISLKNKKIDKLRDYKKSIIYEYVTGKKEVY